MASEANRLMGGIDGLVSNRTISYHSEVSRLACVMRLPVGHSPRALITLDLRPNKVHVSPIGRSPCICWLCTGCRHHAAFQKLEAFCSMSGVIMFSVAVGLIGRLTCSSGKLRRLDRKGDTRHHHRGCVGPDDEHERTRPFSTGSGAPCPLITLQQRSNLVVLLDCLSGK